jgi:mevalonate kinase
MVNNEKSYHWQNEKIIKNASSNYFYGHGKFLLTGEYLVLDGARALALPTKMGQSLIVKNRKSFSPKLKWISLDSNGHRWFEADFEFWHFNIVSDNQNEKEAIFLQKILREARKINPHFMREAQDVIVETRLEFPLSWGLGSSSTLIYNIAQLAYVGPFLLAKQCTNGSGYDIACAQALGPIVYFLEKQSANWTHVNFNPFFKELMYFVYLGKKEDTESSVEYYKNLKIDPVEKNKIILEIDQITSDILDCKELQKFNELLSAHEQVMGSLLNLTPVKEKLFSDFWGGMKSLGAWGGDFILVTSDRTFAETEKYFKEKGCDIILPYQDVICDQLFQASSEKRVH